MELVKAAGMSMCSNTHVNLVMQEVFDQELLRQGITRVKQMWQMGINLFTAQDDYNNPFYPCGRNDQREVAAYLCRAAHMTGFNEIEAAFDFITSNAARALRLKDYGLDPGCLAALNVLAAPTVREILRLQQPPGLVVRQGKVLAHNQLQREFVNR